MTQHKKNNILLRELRISSRKQVTCRLCDGSIQE